MVSFDNSQTHEEVNYAYDVESHQVSESVIDATGKAIASQAFYYSMGDKAQMIAESDSDGNQLSYLFAEEKIGSLDNNNEANLYITDQAGSVVALVSNSQLSHEYLYSPYGIDTDLDTATTTAKNAQGFDGQRTDHATDYQFLGNGYRAYNPILHRFMQMDDIGYSPFGKGGINGYVFGNNNPIMNFDPSGHFSLSWLSFGFALASAVFGIIAPWTMPGAFAISSSIFSVASGVTWAIDAANKGSKLNLALAMTSAVLDIAAPVFALAAPRLGLGINDAARVKAFAANEALSLPNSDENALNFANQIYEGFQVERNGNVQFVSGSVEINGLSDEQANSITTFFQNNGYKRISTHPGDNIGYDLSRKSIGNQKGEIRHLLYAGVIYNDKPGITIRVKPETWGVKSFNHKFMHSVSYVETRPFVKNVQGWDPTGYYGESTSIGCYQVYV